MYHATKSQESRKLMVVEGPSLAVAVVIAAIFYKFGSFLLELAAFLPTWYGISFLFSHLAERLKLVSSD